MADDNPGQAVSLGCGTLILIALIVLLFSNRGQDDLKREIGRLRTEVVELRKAVDAQTVLIKSLKARANEHPASPDAPGGRGSR